MYDDDIPVILWFENVVTIIQWIHKEHRACEESALESSKDFVGNVECRNDSV